MQQYRVSEQCIDDPAVGGTYGNLLAQINHPHPTSPPQHHHPKLHITDEQVRTAPPQNCNTFQCCSLARYTSPIPEVTHRAQAIEDWLATDDAYKPLFARQQVPPKRQHLCLFTPARITVSIPLYPSDTLVNPLSCRRGRADPQEANRV